MKHAAIVSATILASLALAGCSSEYGYDRVGYAGYGGGYAPYGYDEGYYGGGYYPGYASYYGWFGGFYYPGSGFYVYDRYRRPYRWNGEQQRYWQGRLSGYRGPRGGADWRGFAGRGGASGYGAYTSRAYATQGSAQTAQGYRSVPTNDGARVAGGARGGGGSRGGRGSGHAR